jgi:hypothetical protein
MAFANFSDDSASDFEADDLPYSDYLTVLAYLEMHFGDVGKQIYYRLMRAAQKTADDVGGTAGILFNDEGGEFVTFEDDDAEVYDNKDY